jgi:hypothetical protein
MSGIEVKPIVSQKSGSKAKSLEQTADVFPRLDIHFSVFGQLDNLRTFINEIERNNHFVIIDTINLTSVEADEGRRGARSQGGAGISLSINMSAYFQSL